MNGYLSIQEAAEYLQVNSATIQRAIWNKKLKAYKVGDKLWRIKKDDLEAYVKQGVNDGQ